MKITEKENYRIGLMIQNSERQWEFHEVPLSLAFTGSLATIVESLRENDQEVLAENISSLEEDSMDYPWLVFAVEHCKVVSISMEIDDRVFDTEIEIIFRRDTFRRGNHAVHYPYRLDSAALSVFAE